MTIISITGDGYKPLELKIEGNAHSFLATRYALEREPWATQERVREFHNSWNPERKDGTPKSAEEYVSNMRAYLEEEKRKHFRAVQRAEGEKDG